MLWVIAYDIPCDRRRLRIAAILQNYGTRVQYSVFECHLTAWQSRLLELELLEELDLQEDSLCWYPQCLWCAKQRQTYGTGEITLDLGYTIV